MGRPGPENLVKFRFLRLCWHLLASFWAFLNLSAAIFIDFSSPRTRPEPRKSMKNQMVLPGFLLFPYIAQDCRNSLKKAPKRLPRSFRDSPQPLQDRPQCFKMASRWPYWGHIRHHFHLLVASLAFLEIFWVHLGLPYGLRPRFWLDFGLNLNPPIIHVGEAECAERLNKVKIRINFH